MLGVSVQINDGFAGRLAGKVNIARFSELGMLECGKVVLEVDNQEAYPYANQ